MSGNISKKAWLDDIKTTLPPLSKGPHTSPDEGLCAMEMVALIEGLPHSDTPDCVCPVIAAYVRGINDGMSDIDRPKLLPYLPRLVGSVSYAHEQERLEYLAWQAIRVFAPKALEAAGFQKHAEILRQLRDFSDATKAVKAAARDARDLREKDRKETTAAALAATAWAAEAAMTTRAARVGEAAGRAAWAMMLAVGARRAEAAARDAWVAETMRVAEGARAMETIGAAVAAAKDAQIAEAMRIEEGVRMARGATAAAAMELMRCTDAGEAVDAVLSTLDGVLSISPARRAIIVLREQEEERA